MTLPTGTRCPDEEGQRRKEERVALPSRRLRLSVFLKRLEEGSQRLSA
jgi:hypothetical protein